MEKLKLPNASAILILGVLSIPTCCCWGVVGLTLGIVALILAKRDLQLYRENPDLYDGYANINTGRVLAILGIVLSAVYILINIYMYVALGEEGIKDFQENLIEKIKHQQEME